MQVNHVRVTRVGMGHNVLIRQQVICTFVAVCRDILESTVIMVSYHGNPYQNGATCFDGAGGDVYFCSFAPGYVRL